MSFRKDFKVAAGKKVDLSKIVTSFTGGFDKKSAKEKTVKNFERIAELTETLHLAHGKSLLIVMQAMDAGGKDGAIEKLAGAMQPQATRVVSFKVPSKEEADHDFLWRVHKQAPAKGEVVVFNRSHYEDVLVVRVNNYAPEKVWKARYDRINAFESLLAENGTDVLKFYLHISKDEQAERLKARLEEPEKNWKFNEGDMTERAKWDEYQVAFEDALSKCSTKEAPWFIIPADKKWFRDLAISEIVAGHLESLKLKHPDPAFDAKEMLAKHFPEEEEKKAAPASKAKAPARRK